MKIAQCTRFAFQVVSTATISGSLLLAGSITFHASLDPAACTDVHLPPWKDPGTMPGPYWLSYQHCDLDFAALDGGVLVTAWCYPTVPKQGRFYSLSKYAVDLPSGRVRKARGDEWDHADPYLIFRDPATSRRLENYDVLVYQGKKFPKSGLTWPEALPSHYSLLSPDGSSLAVQSWDGWFSCGGDDIWGSCRGDGYYYVDIYNIASGRRLLALKGEVHGSEAPYEPYRVSSWISNRYYVLPLDPKDLRRFVICDVQHASNAVEGTK